MFSTPDLEVHHARMLLKQAFEALDPNPKRLSIDTTSLVITIRDQEKTIGKYERTICLQHTEACRLDALIKDAREQNHRQSVVLNEKDTEIGILEVAQKVHVDKIKVLNIHLANSQDSLRAQDKEVLELRTAHEALRADYSVLTDQAGRYHAMYNDSVREVGTLKEACKLWKRDYDEVRAMYLQKASEKP